MPWIDGRLTATLVAVMLGLQAVCWLLAKGLGLDPHELLETL